MPYILWLTYARPWKGQAGNVVLFTACGFAPKKFAAEPGAGGEPVALDGGGGHLQNFGGFLDAEAGEVAQFHKPALARVDGGEGIQGIVEGDQIQILVLADCHGVIERDAGSVIAPFVGAARAGVIDKNAANHLSGDTVEMGTVLPGNFLLTDHAEPGFVDQSGALQSMAGPFAAKVRAGEAAQFFVDERRHFIESLRVAASPFDKQAGDVFPGCGHIRIFHGSGAVVQGWEPSFGAGAWA
jgi:hypothetical protein